MDHPSKKTNSKKPNWLKRAFAKRPVRYGAIIGALLLAGSLITLVVAFRPPMMVTLNSVKSDTAEPETPPIFYSPLTGVEVDEAKTTAPVIGVMIENSPDARPQSGLKNMGVVFEAVAEGGITRFLGLYQEAEPVLIGPVRSLRPYYVEWAAPFGAAVAHVGGSYNSLQMIRSGNYGVDLDQFFSGNSYWRTTDRWAPHNVYTDYAHLSELASSKGKTTSQFTSFPRTDGKSSDVPDASRVHLGVSTGAYDVVYNYDTGTNSYLRSQGGTPHLDRELGQITADVVIAIRVQMTLGFEDGYREQIPTTGDGECFVFQNGVAQHCMWRKTDAKSQIEFIDAAGQPIKLNRGATWISAVPNGNDISWQ